jgi:hypothetical protein
MSTLVAWRVREIAGSVAALVWAGFHLWEQWSAFAGSQPWVERMVRTSHGTLATAAELLLGILPPLVWMVLDVILRARGAEPDALRSALAEHPEAARRLGLLARVCGWLFTGWLLYHAAWLWLPKFLEGSEPLRAWAALRDGLGRWPHAIAHAVGLTAFAGHAWTSVPRLAVVLGWASSPEARRAARLSGLIVACGMLLLYAQLAGWHAAGRGTIWSGAAE